MDRMLYIAAAGAKETMVAQAINSHNLANVSTTGFRADLATAASAYVIGDGYGSRVYGMTRAAGIDFREGAVEITGGQLDVAVNGGGWIAVQAPDGSEAYSRRGDLRVTELGQLVNGEGLPIMGNGGPIAIPPFQQLEIAHDGTISIQPLGEAPNTLAEVDRIKLINPDPAQLRKGKDGLLRLADGQPGTADAGVTLISGALEASNVNPVEAMVRMIELSRNFETQVKILRSAQENDRVAAEMMRIS